MRTQLEPVTARYYGPNRGILLVGEAPSRRMQETGRTSQCLLRGDLAELCGVQLVTFAGLFARVNVLDEWLGPWGNGSLFPLDVAVPAARRLEREVFPKFRRVVLLGKRVARAFGTKQPEWFAWEGQDPEIVVVPHPSRANRWWNDPGNYSLAEAFWHDLVAHVREGR